MHSLEGPLNLIDNHTIRISFGIANPEQVREALRTAAKRAEELLGYRPDYRLNIAFSMEGQHRSWGYVYTRDERFYSLLTGESEYEVIPDPEWLPPTPEELAWLNRVGGDPEAFVGKPAVEWSAPVVRISRPLLNLDGLYTYTPDQKNRITQRFGVLSSDKGYIKFEPALVPVFNQVSHVLISHKPASKSFTLSMLENIFRYYSTSTDPKYPMVEFTSTHLVKVTYDPKTNDAIFALLMTTVIYDGEPGCSTPLGFTYLRYRG